MGSIPLPALAVNPGPSAADQFGKVLQLKSMLQQQQTQQLQQQALGQENQQRQIQLNDTQAASQAMHEWDGKDINDLPGLISKHGGSANAVMGMRNQILSYQTEKEKLTTAQLADEKTKNDYIAGHLQSVLDAPEEQRPQLFSNAVSDLVQKGYADPSIQNATYQNQGQVENLQKLHMAKSAIDESAKSTAQAREAGAKAQLDILKAKGLQASPGDIQNMVSAVVPANWADPTLAQRTAARMNSARALGDVEGMQKALSDASAEIGKVQTETNPKVQAGKEQVAAVEARASQLIKGMAEPGYAYNPQTGQTQLTDKTTYLQSGGKLQAFRSVGEKDVKDDTMLTNRLADVHQKVAEYEQALQKPVTAKEQGNIAGLLGTEGFKLGALGTEIPMERVNAALNKENLSKLSPNARDQIIAYKNAREAMMGYKTVLSGSGRGSDKSMDLLTQALPDPSYTDPDFSARSLAAFKQNLHVVGQGLPTLPGIKNPQQIEQEVWGNQKTPSGGNSQASDPLGIR